MPSLAPPSASDSRSAYADWLELHTLNNSTGRASINHLVSVLEISGDLSEVLRRDTTSVEFDEAISEAPKEFLSSITFDELEYRAKSLGDAYPFELTNAGASSPSLVRKADWQDRDGCVIYIFCLLASAIREDKIQPRSSLAAIEQSISVNFQICACLAAGGYLGGDVSSFGFPRANGTAFLPALRETYARFGVGTVREKIEEGMPDSLKDGGIDVIAWRAHPDSMPGKLYLVGQSASGRGWKDKTVVEYIDQLHGGWFTHLPQKFTLPAMFIPFTFHADLDEPKEGAFLEKVKTSYWFEEQRFGIIFDRLRITHFGGLCLQSTESHKNGVDGAAIFDNVKQWVTNALGAAELENAA